MGVLISCRREVSEVVQFVEIDGEGHVSFRFCGSRWERGKIAEGLRPHEWRSTAGRFFAFLWFAFDSLHDRASVAQNPPRPQILTLSVITGSSPVIPVRRLVVRCSSSVVMGGSGTAEVGVDAGEDMVRALWGISGDRVCSSL